MAADVNIRIRATDEASGVLGKIGGTFSKILQGAASFIAANVIQKGAQEIFNFAKDSISAASDLTETLNKTQVMFKDASQEIIEWSKNSAEALGMSQQAALDSAAGFAVFGQSAGLSGSELAKFTEEAMERAVDIGSIANATTEEVAQAMQALLRGESEPMRRFGVLADEATLRMKALELGIISTTKEALTPQQKVLAANALIMEQTAYAAGDWARTNDELAGSQKKFQASLEDVKASLGEAFLPLMKDALNFFNSVGIPAIKGLVDGFKEWFAALQSSGGGEFIQTMRAFFGWLGQWWDTYGEPIKAGFAQMGQATGEAFSKIAADIQPFITEVLQKISGWMVENAPLIQEFAQMIADFWTNNLLPAILAFWEAVKPIFSGLVDLVLGLVTVIMQIATGDWAGAWETIKQTAVAVGEALISAVTNLLDAILKLFGTNLDTLLDQMAGWIVNAVMWGRNLVEGIKEGISNAWGSLKSWFQGLWKDLVGGVQNFLGINSPSELFADIGQNMMLGMAQGIGAGATVPVNAITTATSGIVNAVPAGASAGAAGMVINVNISSPMTFMDETNAVENIRKYVSTAFRQLRSEGQV
jgi:hypothetical protein